MEVDDLTYVPPKSKETLRAEKLRREQMKQSAALSQPRRYRFSPDAACWTIPCYNASLTSVQ